jgi:hypothetical protein
MINKPVYREFDRSRLQLQPLAQRQHKLDLSILLPLERRHYFGPDYQVLAERLLSARENRRAAILMMGAHVIRSGVQSYLIDLMERGLISALAMNGAGIIHDYELALIGATTECVERYISNGQFGFWKETGRLNTLVCEAARAEKGLGEAVGEIIETGDFPHRQISLAAAAWRLGIPLTVHVGIGQDIIHQHPDCDGAAFGACSYRDFLRFAAELERLEKGVVMNFGSAVMAPEVYLKALAMVRNVAHQRQEQVADFTTLVADLPQLPGDYHSEPRTDDPAYYFRPWKTMLVRTVKDGGRSIYLQGRHAETIPTLWSAIGALEAQMKGESHDLAGSQPSASTSA